MKSYIRYIWDGGFKLFLGFNGVCLLFILVWIIMDGWQGDVVLSTKWLSGILGVMWLFMLGGNYLGWRNYKRMGP